MGRHFLKPKPLTPVSSAGPSLRFVGHVNATLGGILLFKLPHHLSFYIDNIMVKVANYLKDPITFLAVTACVCCMMRLQCEMEMRSKEGDYVDDNYD